VKLKPFKIILPFAVKLKAWKPMNTGSKGLEYKIHNPEVTGSNPVSF
jgi:hypothetical protein